MSSLLRRWLIELHGDRQVGQRRRRCHRIGDVVGACRHSYVGAAGKGEGFVGSGNNLGGSCRDRPCNMQGCEMQRSMAESVRYADTQFSAADGEMNDLAQRGIAEIVHSERVARLGQLLCRSPRANPTGLSDGIGGSAEQKKSDRKETQRRDASQSRLRAWV